MNGRSQKLCSMPNATSFVVVAVVMVVAMVAGSVVVVVVVAAALSVVGSAAGAEENLDVVLGVVAVGIVGIAAIDSSRSLLLQ